MKNKYIDFESSSYLQKFSIFNNIKVFFFEESKQKTCFIWENYKGINKEMKSYIYIDCAKE